MKLQKKSIKTKTQSINDRERERERERKRESVLLSDNDKTISLATIKRKIQHTCLARMTTQTSRKMSGSR